MPLLRFGVRNEYGLGGRELYNDAVQAEDPKGVLDGVAVAGLVGILRQLGDLAEFAAEIFHGLQEQVASTASRSRTLVTRVQRIEASLPQLEKAILSQTSHIHYAYTPGSSFVGSEWHAHIRNEQNHFICDDLPPFLMDSYEECREPPRLQLLDRFDSGGSGSCLKRYSDPTFFKRASASSEAPDGEKSLRERKARKIKRRRSWQQTARFTNGKPILNGSERMQLSSPTAQGKSSLSHTGSTFDTTLKSDLGDPSDSLGSKDGMDFVECVFHPSTSIQPDDANTEGLSSGLGEEMMNAHESIYVDGQKSGACSPTIETMVPPCSSVTWDEKEEIVEPMGLNYGANGIQYVPEANSSLDEQGLKPAIAECFNQVDDLSEHGSSPKSNLDGHNSKTALDDIQDLLKENIDLDKKELKLVNAESVNQVDDLSEHEGTTNSLVGRHYLKTVIDGSSMEFCQPNGVDYGIDEGQYMLENFELHEHDMGTATMECIPQVEDLSGGENNLELIADGSPINDPLDRNLGISEAPHALDTNSDMQNDCHVNAVTLTVIEWNQLDDNESETDHYVDALNTIESESESDFEGQTQKEIVLFSRSKDELVEKTINERKEEMTINSVLYDHKEQTPDDSQNSTALVSFSTMESLEHAQSSCSVSGAEITSHQEPEHGSLSVSYNQNVLCAEITSHQEPDHECYPVSYDHNEQSPDDSQHSTALVSSANMESLGQAQSVMHGSFQQLFPVPEMSLFGYLETSQHLIPHLNFREFPFTIPVPIPVCAPIPVSVQLWAQSSCNLSGAEIISHQEPEHKCHFLSYDHKDLTPDDSHYSTALVSSSHMESLGHAQSIISHQDPEHESLSVSYDQNVLSAEITGHQEAEHECYPVSDDHNEQTPDDSQYSTALVSSANMESLGQAQSSCNIPGAEIISHQEPEHESHFLSYDHKDLPPDDSHNSTALVSSANVESLGHALSSCNVSAAAEGEKLDDSASLFDGESVQCNQSSSGRDVSQGIDFCANKPAVNKVAASGSNVPPSQEMSVGPSSNYPLAFWTNGTLLGLQPSKPTVFSPRNTVTSDPRGSVGNFPVGQSNPNVMQKVDSTGLLASSAKDRGSGNDSKESKLDNGDQGAGFYKHMSHKKLDKKHDKSIDHDTGNLANQPVIHSLSNGSSMCHETKVPRTADVENVSGDAINTSEDKSSSLSLPGCSLLKNGLRTGSLGYKNRSKPETISKGKLNSPVNSPPPSPPLEHMKISFQPIDGFEISRLKLKYPEGVDHHELSVYTFPSFQLVPEPTNWKCDVGSDSDDDTFSRSYACMSDDYISHLSDSNSDEWESGETSESNDHALYDDLCRISSTEYTSNSPENEAAAHGSIVGSTPETPPLPPLQWRVSKPLLDAEDGKQDQGSDSQPFDPKLSWSSIPPLLKVDSAKLPSRSKESATITETKQLDEHKLDPQNQNYQVANGQRADDSFDFLHQIRAKSLNLRRTETARSTFPTSTATSNKVTAILQKANAIRQAVGSDGDDDSWSDT